MVISSQVSEYSEDQGTHVIDNPILATNYIKLNAAGFRSGFSFPFLLFTIYSYPLVCLFLASEYDFEGILLG